MIPASGSSEESRIVGEIVRPVLEVVVGKGNVTDHLVRKLAHFTEYMVLGCLMGANVAVRARMNRMAAGAAERISAGDGMPVTLAGSPDAEADTTMTVETLVVRPAAPAATTAAPAMNSWFLWSYGLLLCLAVAVIDESIQIFSPGRGPQVTDVLLDTCGSFTGMVVMWAIDRLRLIRH